MGQCVDVGAVGDQDLHHVPCPEGGGQDQRPQQPPGRLQPAVGHVRKPSQDHPDTGGVTLYDGLVERALWVQDGLLQLLQELGIRRRAATAAEALGRVQAEAAVHVHHEEGAPLVLGLQLRTLALLVRLQSPPPGLGIPQGREPDQVPPVALLRRAQGVHGPGGGFTPQHRQAPGLLVADPVPLARLRLLQRLGLCAASPRAAEDAAGRPPERLELTRDPHSPRIAGLGNGLGDCAVAVRRPLVAVQGPGLGG
mmetsp:Transcript_55386/g.98613  ORF Transcript_55386/g.98613 Transcript_55386/m.98613 type:complete len:253 (-) Transcript_55386:38-796(-)